MDRRAPFFRTPERLAALEAAAQAWVGTPFAHNGCVRGPLGGACCHGLAWGVLADAGWAFGEAMPLGKASHARHHREEIILPWLRARCGSGGLLAEISPVEVAQLQPGDITTHRFGLCTHHVALVVPGGFLLETWSRRSAGLRTLADATATKRMTAIFRPLDPHA
jgi:hypothetical protein